MWRILLVSLTFFGLISAQILEKPRFGFERFSWGTKAISIVPQFTDKGIKRDMPDEKNPFSKSLSEILSYSYRERIGKEIVNIGLQFDIKDSTLVGIAIAYIGIDSLTHKLLLDVEDRQLQLLTELTSHFSAKPEQRSIPFVGTVSTWSLPHLSVKAINTSQSLMIVYKKN